MLAIASCVIIYKRRDNTFVRDIGLLLILLIVQLIAPIVLFTLLVRGPGIYYSWILPIPGPSLVAMILRVFYRTKSSSAPNLNPI